MPGCLHFFTLQDLKVVEEPIGIHCKQIPYDISILGASFIFVPFSEMANRKLVA